MAKAKTDEEHLDEFKVYCRELPDQQVLGVIDKHRDRPDDFSKSCLKVAQDEAYRRRLM